MAGARASASDEMKLKKNYNVSATSTGCAYTQANEPKI